MTDTTIAFTPAEWAPQSAIWAGWPHLKDAWAEDYEGAQREIAALVAALAPVVRVKLVIGDPASRAEAADLVGGKAEMFDAPMGDIWLRDIGPVFVKYLNRLEGLGFEFNGWGGKYELEGDSETAAAIARLEGHPLKRLPFVLEGGAVEQDGAGVLITTRQCVLNPNRNPGWTQEKAEENLKLAFNAERIVWLGDGLLGDHTDGHVDNIARFIAPGHVVCQTPSGTDDPNADVLREIEDTLRAAELQVSTIPSPGRILDEDGEIMPASHMNFLISNGRVILPVYEDEHAKLAETELQALMPEHEVIALPSRHILSGGGSFHCMTQQVPQTDGGLPT
ncbi:agmatine deiminase family protein [Henriciella barbarensis]|uniref:Agmatine deiminase family protein n=1 Tax=Henriciella barbarensis TaxID=86342 RepID=A0A399R2G2_9PROT|nr:agmatine deiminase family protein [Henriciella barbarensis]RIJ23922.1 agmatine deiminase family protein [Henriciella barbarensis]